MKQAIHLFKTMQQSIYQFKTRPAGVRAATTTKIRSNKRIFTLALLLAAAVIGTAALGQRGALAQSGGGGGADYSNVSNAFAGFTHILRQDDLVVNIGSYTAQSFPNFLVSSLSAITTADSNGTQNYDAIYNPSYYTQDTTVVTGRFFKTLQDTAVSYPARRDNQDLVDILVGERSNDGNASFSLHASQLLPYGTNTTTISQGYVADFSADGYDDLLMTYSDHTTRYPDNQRMRIATAIDINDPSQGFNFGAEQTLVLPDAIQAAAVGDFNGDGQPDIAYASQGIDNVLNVYICSVDPQTLSISRLTQTYVDTMASASQNQPIQLVAGNFTGSSHQQLVVAHPSGANNNIKLRLFDFAEASYIPVLQQTWDSAARATKIKLLASKYDWGSPYDVITFMQTFVNGPNSESYIKLLTVDPASYAMTISATVDVATTYANGLKDYVALDIAVGNFNNQKPDPADPSKTINDPNLQLAFAAGHTTDDTVSFTYPGAFTIQVIDQKTGKINLEPHSSIFLAPPSGDRNAAFQNLTINAADLQGRSLRLGGGYKISIDKASPSLILAQPPLHVDWAPVDLSSSSPTVRSLSFAPDRFNAGYTTTDTTSSSSTSSKTTGWGFSGNESLGGTLTFGETDPAGNLENGVKISETFTAQQDLNHSTETTNGSSATVSQTIAQTTGTNDVVWYQDGITYLYVYEVIDQTVCPATTPPNPNCLDSDRVPLTVMFSAPGPTSTQYLSAEALEWYQPVWENGNVLSYPANNNQLLKYMDNTAVFGSATQRTDSSVASFSTAWANTSSQGQNVGFSSVFKEDSDTNIEAAAGEEVFDTGASASVDLNFDFGGSTSLSTMRTTSSTINHAQGMTINRNVNFPDTDTYGYNFSGVIFGKNAPLGYFDGTDPNTPGTGLPSAGTDLNIFGPMRSAFTVDPLANNQGGWWSHSYTAAPDVALNHPNRWSQTKTTASNPPLRSNCIGTNDGYMDCATQKTRQPIDPWDDSFHSMRGFFIFKAGDANPNDPNNQGLQQQYATAGDQLSLQARVYNYSLQAMPAGTQVKARFYAMPWNTTTALPADYVDVNNPGGASFLIGETTLSPVPAWNNDTDNVNYSIASVPFDTTGRDDQDLVFWVAVWMQDASGKLVGELSGKGLTALPTSLTTPTFFQMTGLEPTTPNLWKTNDADPDTTSFSNNIGFYKQPFYIAPKNSQATQVLSQTFSDVQRSLAAVSIKDADVREPSINLGQSSEVFATLHNGAGKEDVEGLSVYFYDGDPAAKRSKLFDIDRLAHIRSGADHKVRVRFTPQQCGMHNIFVKVVKSGMSGTTGGVATPLRVRCTIPYPGDTTPPQLNVTLTANTLSAPNDQTDSQTDNQLDDWMVAVTAQIEVSDQQDPRPDIRLEAITHNGTSDDVNDVAEAEFGTDDRTFLVRAKGAGKIRDGRIYEVIYSATDWAGNKTYVKAYVTVPYDQ